MNRYKGKTILIVDDEESIRDTLRIHLEGAGYKVLSSENGQEAIDILRESKVSLVITDIKMPKVDGFAVLDYARQHLQYVPVVMLTGYIEVDLAVKSMKGGSYHYLTKPFKKIELMNVVEEALVRAEQAKESGSFHASQVYLLTEAGTLIYHSSNLEPSGVDSDIFGSMLTAVRMFIEDSFSRTGDSTKSFHYGDSRILIEEGSGFFLVVIGEGEGVSGVRDEMKQSVKKIDERFGNAIASWNGDVDIFKGIETEFHKLSEYGGLEAGITDHLKEELTGELEPRNVRLTEEEEDEEC